LVFSSARTGEGDLYLVDFSKPGEPVRLSSIPGSSEVDAAWSPDGAAVAFVAHTDAGDNVWVIDNVRAKSEPRRLTADTATQVRPTWAPSSPLRLAFYQYAPGSGSELDRVDLMVATPQGGVRKLVEGIVPDEQGPAWTPDGLHLVVVLDDSAAFDPIARVDAKSGTVTRLSTGTVGNRDLTVGYTREGDVFLAVCAQGEAGDALRDFRRVMVMPLEL
jgi:Tol biopolymer transport system component